MSKRKLEALDRLVNQTPLEVEISSLSDEDLLDIWNTVGDMMTTEGMDAMLDELERRGIR